VGKANHHTENREGKTMSDFNCEVCEATFCTPNCSARRELRPKEPPRWDDGEPQSEPDEAYSEQFFFDDL
jgi:hypothetical protein